MAEEVLNGIKTVFAFGGEQVEIERYNKHLNIVKKIVTRKGFFTGIGEGIMRFVFFGITGITFWYGTQMVLSDRENVDKKYSIAILFIVCVFSSCSFMFLRFCEFIGMKNVHFENL